MDTINSRNASYTGHQQQQGRQLQWAQNIGDGGFFIFFFAFSLHFTFFFSLFFHFRFASFAFIFLFGLKRKKRKKVVFLHQGETNFSIFCAFFALNGKSPANPNPDSSLS